MKGAQKKVTNEDTNVNKEDKKKVQQRDVQQGDVQQGDVQHPMEGSILMEGGVPPVESMMMGMGMPNIASIIMGGGPPPGMMQMDNEPGPTVYEEDIEDNDLHVYQPYDDVFMHADITINKKWEENNKYHLEPENGSIFW